METTATLRGVRLSAQKGRLVADLVRGMPVGRALDVLAFSPKKGAAIIRKVAEEEGILVADVWAAWKAELKKGTNQDSLLAQANHPNKKGHEIAAKVIAGMFGVR